MQQTDFLQAGASLETAEAAMIMMHGRGANAQDMFSLAQEFSSPGLAFLAPQAPGGSWYPYPFLAPLQNNEPQLSQSLQVLANLFSTLQAAGFTPDRVILLGFSQGASLSLEYAARNARRYGGIAGLSGGLIGPPGISRDYPGSFDHTPVFLGCSDRDPYIPAARVLESEQVFKRMGAQVTARLYPNLGHTVNEDELDFVRGMIRELFPPA